MPDKSVISEGRPVWADVTAPDAPSAAEFYQHVFGWEYHVAPSELAYYHTALEAGLKAAGLSGLSSPDGVPSWTVSFAVADVTKAVAKANDLGGVVIMEPTEIPQQAMVAMVEAPGGARFGLWQSFHHHGFEVRNEHGAFAWCEAGVSDVRAAAVFYRALFGLDADAVGDEHHQLLARQGSPLAGVSERHDYQPHDEWLVYFQVHDTDAAIAAVQAGGGSVLFGPKDTRDGRVAVCSDENGARFGVVRP